MTGLATAPLSLRSKILFSFSREVPPTSLHKEKVRMSVAIVIVVDDDVDDDADDEVVVGLRLLLLLR